jgi:hypothetical protein
MHAGGGRTSGVGGRRDRLCATILRAPRRGLPCRDLGRLEACRQCRSRLIGAARGPSPSR